jgi:hypothetical protein
MNRIRPPAWYEWFPSAWINFSGISFKAGDSVTITVHASSSTSGTATIKNNSNGQQVSHTVSAGGNPALCQADVEWIMEDYSEGLSIYECYRPSANKRNRWLGGFCRLRHHPLHEPW